MWNKITIKLILCYNLYVFCYFIYSKLSCNFIKIRLWGKCSPVNFLHIFGTPFPKYTTGGLRVGGKVSMSTFFTWMHVCFILFGQINTVFSQCEFYFNLFSWNINVIKYYNLFTRLFCKVFISPWLEYQTSSILLCSHDAYCLNRVCKQENLQSFQISFVYYCILNPIMGGLFEPPFWVCVCVFEEMGRRGGGGQKCPSTSTFAWRHWDAWNFAQPIFNTIGFQWRKYIPCDDYWIKKYGQPWIKNRVALLFFLESKQTE